MNEPPDTPLLFKALDYGWALIGALGAMVWKSQNAKIEAVSNELGIQRANVAKLFDKLEEHSHRAEDRHHEILNALHAGLDRKADK